MRMMSDPNQGSVYFHVVETPTPRSRLVGHLYDNPAPELIDYFFNLNRHLTHDPVPSGTLVVVPSANSQTCTQLEADLAEYAQNLQNVVQDPATFNRNYSVLDAVTSQGPGGLGAYSAAMGFRLKLIADLLKEIETLHIQTYNKTGNLRSKAFFQRRKALFDRLDAALGTLIRDHIVHSGEQRMRHALGISSKSIVNRWKRQGGKATGIPEFERHYRRQAQAARIMKGVGYAGIGLDVYHSYRQLREACTVDNDDPRCTRRKFTETGRLPLSIIGGMAGGAAGYGVCNLIFAAPSAGTSLLWCGILVGGVGAYAGGYAGSSAGHGIGEYVYEKNYPIDEGR